MRAEVQLATSTVGYVRVQLGRREIGVAEHLLDAAEVRAALEQGGRERMAQQVRVHTRGLEAGVLGEGAQQQERPGAGEPPAARVREELLPVLPVEEGTAVREVAA